MNRMRNGALAIFTLLLGMSFAWPCTADELRNGPDIQKQFRVMLPGHWRLENLNVEASASYGTQGEPLIKQKFIADLVLREDTYALDQKEGAVTWVVPVAKAGEKRVVHGIATSVRKGDVWQTQLGLEKDPTKDLGQPLSAFAGKVIVRGTPQEKEYLEWQARTRQVKEELAQMMEARKREAEAARVQKAEMARLQREAELKEKKQQAELKEYEYQQKIDVARQKALERQARNRLALDLPGYWRIKTFSAEETVAEAAPDKSGQQKIVQKFTAVIELASDTFNKSDEKIGAATLLTPIAKAGAQRRIYGKLIASVDKNAGPIVLVEYENPVIKELGKPIDFFGGRTLVQGSREAEEYRQKLHKQSHTKLQQERQLEEERRKAEAERVASARKLKEENEQRIARERETADKKREAVLTALQAALRGKDDAARLRAMDAAFKSGDPQQQNLALASYLERQKGISGQFVGGKDGSVKVPFRITLDKFDPSTTQFSGKVNVGPFASAVEGSLQGTTLFASAYFDKGHRRYFSFNAQLQENNRMAGSANGDFGQFNGFFRPNTVMITLP